MNVIYGFLWHLVTLSAISSADPVVLPVGQVDGGQLGVILPNEKVLLGILAAQALQLLVWAGKTLWASFVKDKDKTEAKVDALAGEIHQVTLAVQELKAELKLVSKLPSEAEIIKRLEERAEWMIFKAVRDLDLRKTDR